MQNANLFLQPQQNTQIFGHENSSQRLVKQAAVDYEFIRNILDLLDLKAFGNIRVPDEGRIASNIIVHTHDRGDVMLRFYPAGCQDTKLESGCVDFEVVALHYLSSGSINVPSPILFPNEKPVFERDGIKIFAYQLVPGESLKPTELTVEIASLCGSFLKQMIAVSEKYVPEGTIKLPEGDLDYISEIYHKQLERFPTLKMSSELREMHDLVSDLSLKSELSKTPKGIVHADFFFENILLDEATGKLGAIDFGDAYFGSVVMDIVIGSMEFCVLEDRSWDLEMFSAFIKPNSKWLRDKCITFDLFYKLLQANCLRFAIYTLPTTLEENESIESNPYIYRFNYLKDQNFKDELEKHYNEIVR